MFRSRLTLEQYLSFVQHDTMATSNPSLDDIGDIQLEEDVRDDEHDDHIGIAGDLDPSLITIPSEFNDHHEVLVIAQWACSNLDKTTQVVGEMGAAARPHFLELDSTGYLHKQEAVVESIISRVHRRDVGHDLVIGGSGHQVGHDIIQRTSMLSHDRERVEQNIGHYAVNSRDQVNTAVVTDALVIQL